MGFPQPPDGSAIQLEELPNKVELCWGDTPRNNQSPVRQKAYVVFCLIVWAAIPIGIFLTRLQPTHVLILLLWSVLWALAGIRLIVALFSKTGAIPGDTHNTVLRLTEDSLIYFPQGISDNTALLSFQANLPYQSVEKRHIAQIGWKKTGFSNGLFVTTDRTSFEVGRGLKMDDLVWLRQFLLKWQEQGE